MLKTLLGADGFREGMDLYFERHDGEAATVEQFVQCFADVSGRDLSQFFAGISKPARRRSDHVTLRCARQNLSLDVIQKIPPTPGQPAKEPMVIPLAIELLGKNGGELPLVLDGRPLERGVLTLKEPSQSFTFSGIAERPIPSLNRGFSAPVSCRSQSSLTIFVSSRRTIPIRSIAGRQCRRWRCRSSPQMSQPYARALRSARMKD